jgi:hypothetical protein
MAIHWKALEEHFLMVPLVFQFIFGGKIHFLNFSQKTSVVESKPMTSYVPSSPRAVPEVVNKHYLVSLGSLATSACICQADYLTWLVSFPDDPPPAVKVSLIYKEYQSHAHGINQCVRSQWLISWTSGIQLGRKGHRLVDWSLLRFGVLIVFDSQQKPFSNVLRGYLLWTGCVVIFFMSYL